MPCELKGGETQYRRQSDGEAHPSLRCLRRPAGLVNALRRCGHLEKFPSQDAMRPRECLLHLLRGCTAGLRLDDFSGQEERYGELIQRP